MIVSCTSKDWSRETIGNKVAFYLSMHDSKGTNKFLHFDGAFFLILGNVHSTKLCCFGNLRDRETERQRAGKEREREQGKERHRQTEIDETDGDPHNSKKTPIQHREKSKISIKKSRDVRRHLTSNAMLSCLEPSLSLLINRDTPRSATSLQRSGGGGGGRGGLELG
jgi:hypothetical protein